MVHRPRHRSSVSSPIVTSDAMTPPLPLGLPDLLDQVDEVTVHAIDLVVDASGEFDAWFATGAQGLEGRPDAMRRLARWAGVSDLDEVLDDGRAWLTYDGLWRLDLPTSLRLVKAMARRHRRRVEAHLQDEQRRIARGGVSPGGDRRATAARATVRAWMDGDG
jgi:hypothetical protein